MYVCMIMNCARTRKGSGGGDEDIVDDDDGYEDFNGEYDVDD